MKFQNLNNYDLFENKKRSVKITNQYLLPNCSPNRKLSRKNRFFSIPYKLLTNRSLTLANTYLYFDDDQLTWNSLLSGSNLFIAFIEMNEHWKWAVNAVVRITRLFGIKRLILRREEIVCTVHKSRFFRLNLFMRNGSKFSVKAEKIKNINLSIHWFHFLTITFFRVVTFCHDSEKHVDVMSLATGACYGWISNSNHKLCRKKRELKFQYQQKKTSAVAIGEKTVVGTFLLMWNCHLYFLSKICYLI